MTDHLSLLILLVVCVPVLAALLTALIPTPVIAGRVSSLLAIVTAALSVAIGVIALAEPKAIHLTAWYQLDPIGGIFVGVIGLVGLGATLVSPRWLRHLSSSWLHHTRSYRFYYCALNLFWAALLVIPLVKNLGIAWLIIEVTTVVSALLVSFTAKRNALEAGWKYVILTTLGLAVALLGIVIIYLSEGDSNCGLTCLDWQTMGHIAPTTGGAAVVGFVLLIAGFATKIGWAPVHNWLPDAHGEAPPPVSAMLSAALLPAVILIAWRTAIALSPAVGESVVQALLLGFGLLSLAIAVPFLWQSLPWKRLLAYSSLEHMGVLALGIGFGTPLAIAGVIIHFAGHAIAKSLGFYVAIPLLRQDAQAAERAALGVARSNPSTAAAMTLGLATLGGLPPLPLFIVLDASGGRVS